MKKMILKLEFHNDKSKKKALKTVSGLSGVESIAVDSKDYKLTITGDVDPVTVVAKLRKLCCTELVSVGPAKEPEKKKEEPKKDDAKKNEPKKEDDKKKADPYYHQCPHYLYHPPMLMYCYPRTVEEDPNACVII